MRFNREKFFSNYTKAFGKLTTSQVNGLEFLLSKIESDGAWPSDLRQIAYFLATIYHETAKKFQPIREVRERSDSPRRKNQDRYWLTGYYGRGYVQITWESNYHKFDIASTPDKALEPETSYKIAAMGMRQGLFTGRRLTEFFSNSKEDFRNARQIINGLDKADLIASIAKKFQAILALALERQESSPQPEETAPAVSATVVEKSEATSPSSLMGSIREGYSSASESEKSLVARILQLAWAALAGLLAFIQERPVQIGITIAVLLVGIYVFNQYAKRQTDKTMAKLQLPSNTTMTQEITTKT